MADKFITELNLTSTIVTDDYLVVEHDPGGTPETMRIQWSALQDLITNFQSYQIVVSVASNNLTLAIKYIDGNDASTTKSMKFKIGNGLYNLTAAVSFTKNAGTNWCNAGGVELAAQPIDFFVYAIGETGASSGLKFGFSRIPYAKTMSDFVNTSTNEKYIAGNWTNFNASDVVVNIGRFRAQLSATAAFNWSIASQLVVNRPIFETDILTWTPTHSRITTPYTNLPVTNLAVYILSNRILNTQERHTQNAVPGGTGIARFTLPFTVLNNYPTASGFDENDAHILSAWMDTNRQLYAKYDGTAEAVASHGYNISGRAMI